MLPAAKFAWHFKQADNSHENFSMKNKDNVVCYKLVSSYLFHGHFVFFFRLKCELRWINQMQKQ